MNRNNMEYTETTNLETVLPELDVLYMTRVQRERFADLDQYERLKDSYILNVEKLATAKSDLIVLHPLPRVNEISVAVDKDPRACYFKQARNGKFMRMALILLLLSEKSLQTDMPELPAPSTEHCCHNPACITSCEQELAPIFRQTDGVTRCIYCDAEVER